jgi:hypothetical protein
VYNLKYNEATIITTSTTRCRNADNCLKLASWSNIRDTFSSTSVQTPICARVFLPVSRHWVLSAQLACSLEKGRPDLSLRTKTCKRLGSHRCALRCTLPQTFSPAQDMSLPHRHIYSCSRSSLTRCAPQDSRTCRVTFHEQRDKNPCKPNTQHAHIEYRTHV